MVWDGMGIKINKSFYTRQKNPGATKMLLAMLFELSNVIVRVERERDSWRNVGEIPEKIAGLLQNWIILCPMDKREEMRGHIAELRHLASRPERLQ
jgi:hypothetical protein